MESRAGPAVLNRLIEGLSPSQRRAVLTQSRFCRLVAGAGAGKTETLTRRIVYLLASGVQPESIVAFTFTEKAAASMKERIYSRVRDLLGHDVARGLGKTFIGTMHSYAGRLLQERFGYGNHDVLDENQEAAFILQHGWDLGLYGERYGEYWLQFLRSQSVVNDELLSLDDVRKEDATPSFADDVERYWNLLDTCRLLTFSRMVRLAAEHLCRERPELEVRHLIVDEYQDINRAQEALIEAIISCGSASCMIVGDPRQCIYEWRGSDPGCFARFKPGSAETIDLLENRRSAQPIVEVANSVARHFGERELQKAMTVVRSHPGLAVVAEHETPEEEADWVARHIRSAVDEGLRFSDLAVLLRSVSTSGDAFVRAFERHRIPYLVGGKIGLFRRPEADGMASLWMWVAGHDRYLGYAERIRHGDLLEHAQDRWPDGFKVARVEEFGKMIRAGRYRSLVDAYYDLLVRLDYLKWKPDEENAVRMANLGRFSQILLDFESAVWRGGGRMRWETLLNQLGWYINTYAQTGYGEEAADDLPDVDACTISTVHQAKGLEWPVVFVPCLTTRRFPSSRMGVKQNWLLSRSLFDAARYEGNTESERRLFYVAVTRARDVLVLSRFRRITKYVKPSPFLWEIGSVERHSGSLALGDIAVSRATSDDELTTLSMQDIISYRRCPHEYRMRNVWGYGPELVRELGFGRSIHHILRVLAEYAKKGVDPDSVVNDVVNQHFFLPYETPQATDSIKPRVVHLIRRFLQQHGNILRNAEEAEMHLEFFLERHAVLAGRADVIVSDGNAVEVVDYKTADDARIDADVELQVQLYSLGLSESGRTVTRARVVHVLDGGTDFRDVPVDRDSLDHARQMAQMCLSGIIKREFPPKKSEGHCGRCDVRKICCYRA